MKEGDSIKIDVLFADCDSVISQSFFHQKGVRIADLIPLLNRKLKKTLEKSNAMAINSVLVDEETSLDTDTRIMILKKLIVDPKEQRRNRAKLTQSKKVKK